MVEHTSLDTCESCGADVSPESQPWIKGYLTNLGTVRTQRLAELFGGKVPVILCPGCFTSTSSVVNNVGELGGETNEQ